MDEILDKCRGCLVGGAVGDALGYAVEFDNLKSILQEYGKKGITEYQRDNTGTARFSDDTQMTLFTAEGLLTGIQDSKGGIDEEKINRQIRKAYEAWYETQTAYQLPLSYSWLSNIRDLWSIRAPGNTCLTSLKMLKEGLEATNDSKGCGGVMRVAPVGILFGARLKDDMSMISMEEMVARIAGAASLVTHHHPISTLSSALTALIVFFCIQETKLITRTGFKEIVNNGLKVISNMQIPSEDRSKPDQMEQIERLITRAMKLAESNQEDQECIAKLGEGWIAEETLAIAIFSVMKHVDSFEKCIVCAVNHDGDSDSTGAVAGNIIGAISGYHSIPDKYKEGLELLDVILSVADDLAGITDKDRMRKRYEEHEPAGVPDNLTIFGTMKYTPENITELGPDDIFVFGSNLQGHHAGGAARVAADKFGAVWGQGTGLQGRSYAIPTMQGGVDTIKPYVDEFLEVARECDQNTFYVTRIGCGIAGFRDEEIAPLFKDALKMYNVRLPESFVKIIKKMKYD